MSAEPLRFTDILTTASAVATYVGEADVSARHLLDALALLRGAKTMEDLGRPRSPLVRPRGRGGAEAAVRALVQRWWLALGEDVLATLGPAEAGQFEADVRALLDEGESAPPP